MESNDKLEQLLRQMYAQESLHDNDLNTSDIIDEEWTKFEAEHFSGERFLDEPSGKAEREVRGKRLPFLKIAALSIGVLMLSGITYAAVHIIRSQETVDSKQETVATANTQHSTLNSQLAEQDSTLMQPVVFEDAELGTILREIATFYQCTTVYKNEKVKHVRLYFTWNNVQ